MKSKIRKTSLFITSLVTILGININLNKDLNFFESLNCNDIKYVFEFIGLIYILKKVRFDNKKLNICCLIISILLSSMHLIGYYINNYMYLCGMYSTKSNIIKSIFSFIGYMVIIYLGCYFLFDKIKNVKLGEIKTLKKLEKLNNIKVFSIFFILLFIAYLPYFLNFYPGIMSFDSIFQIHQSIGIEKFTAHHPVLHTLIIKLCIKLGLIINGSYELGTGIYSFIQILFMSFVFATVLTYMKKNNINLKLVILFLLYYMFYPVFGMYSVTMWKDVPFALAFSLYIICIYEIICNKDEYLKSKKSNVLFIVSTLLMIFFRNNGFYVFILTIPFVYIYAKKYYKKLTIIFVIIIFIYKFVNGPVLNYFNTEKGSIKEALSVPLQQLARVEINKHDFLTDYEYTEIHNFIKIDNIKLYYNPKLSDPIKEKFNVEYFEKNKLKFIKLWVSLFFKYPKEYIESFLCNSVGYWYPETVHTVISKNIYHFDKGIYLERNSIIKIDLIEKWTNFIEARNVPVIAMIFSIGANMWIIFILFMYCIYSKKYNLFLLYIPVFALWLTILASPVHAEYRYIFGIFTTLPFVISVTLKK